MAKEFKLKKRNEDSIPSGDSKIEIFKSKVLRSGLLKPNSYKVEFTVPRGIVSSPIELDVLQLMSKGAVFSFYTFEVIENFINNTTMNYVNKINFEPIALRFFVDTDGKLMEFLKQWNIAQYDNVTGMFGYRDDYATDITVSLLDIQGVVRSKVTYHRAFPISIEDIELGYDANDAVMEVNVSFAYDYPSYDNKLYAPDFGGDFG